MLPLSSYGFPFQLPLNLIGLPICQSVEISDPKKNCLSVLGVVSAFHTAEGGAFTVVRTCDA
jgi:hypothetical protein